MSRVVGFSLRVEGSQNTIQEIKNIDQALLGISKQIKSIQKIDAGVLKPLADGQAAFKKAVEETNKILNAQIKILQNLGSKSGADTSLIDSLKKQILDLKEQIKSLKKDIESVKSAKVDLSGGDSTDKLNDKLQDVFKGLKEFSPQIEALITGTTAKIATQIADVENKLKAVRENVKTVKGSGGSSEDLGKLILEEKALTTVKKELNKQLDEEAAKFKKVADTVDPTSLIGLRGELKKLKDQYFILGEEARQAAQGQELFQKIVATNSSITNIEQSVGIFSRNVGNYKEAVTSIIPTLERLQQEGVLTQSTLIKSFQAETRNRAKQLKEEVQKLAQAFERMTAEQRKSASGVAVFTELKEKANELNTLLKTTPDHVGGIKQSFIGLGDLITGGLITGGIIVAIGAIKQFGASSVQEFKEAEIAISKVRAQLEATGGTSGKTAEQLKALAQNLEINTGIDADTILDQVTSKLLTFQRVQGEAFGRAQEAAVDLAQVMGGDLAGATTLLGKALNDPEKAIGKLAKAGIQLSSDTQKQIKAAIQANDTYKAQTLILEEVEDRVKGVSSAINNSELTGLRKWTVEWNNFKEAFGKAVVSILNGFFNLVSEFNKGTLLVPTGLKEIKGALNELKKVSAEETASINSSFNSLKDYNLSLETKKAIIDKIVAKYPELVKAYELEGASISELERIQKRLTTTLSQESVKRSQLSTKEIIQSKIAAQELRIQYASINDASGLSLGDNQFLSGQFGKGREKAFQKIIEDAKVQIDKFNKELQSVDSKINYKALDIDENKVTNTFEDATNKIERTRERLFRSLQDDKLTKATRKEFEKLYNEFNKFNGFNDTERGDEKYINGLIARSDEVNATIDKLTKKEIKALDDSNGELDKNTKKLEKSTDDQKKRIEAIKNRIKELTIDSISDEFDKQSDQLKLKTKTEVDELKAKIKELKDKPKLSILDKQEIDAGKALIEELGKTETKELNRISQARELAIKEARNELKKLRDEVNLILGETTTKSVQAQIDTSGFNLEQKTRTITLEYDTNLESLENEFSKGLISQKEFEEKSKELELNKLNLLLDANVKYVDEVSDNYDKLLAEQLLLNKAKRDQLLLEAELEAQAKQAKNLESFQSGNFGKGQAALNSYLENAVLIASGLNAKIQEINNDSFEEEQKLTRENVTNKQKAADEIVNITKAANGITKESDKKLSDEQKENIQRLKETAIETARIVSDAIFEIERNNADRVYNTRIEALEREKTARLKLVKGNTAEEDRINREFDAKKRKLDAENHEAQKRAAIKQAIINGSLAAIQSLALTTVPFPASLLALIPIAASVAAQIAVIKSQSFAEGGFTAKKITHGYTGRSNELPDRSGKRPVGTATIHENEYFANAEQVTDYPELFHELEQDRLSRKRGHGGTLKPWINKNLVLKAIQRHEQEPLIKTRVIKADPPVLYQFTHYMNRGNQTVTIPDEAIENMANKIAERAEQAILNGVEGGYSKAVKELTRDELRKIQLQQRKAI